MEYTALPEDLESMELGSYYKMKLQDRMEQK